MSSLLQLLVGVDILATVAAAQSGLTRTQSCPLGKTIIDKLGESGAESFCRCFNDVATLHTRTWEISSTVTETMTETALETVTLPPPLHVAQPETVTQTGTSTPYGESSIVATTIPTELQSSTLLDLPTGLPPLMLTDLPIPTNLPALTEHPTLTDSPAAPDSISTHMSADLTSILAELQTDLPPISPVLSDLAGLHARQAPSEKSCSGQQALTQYASGRLSRACNCLAFGALTIVDTMVVPSFVFTSTTTTLTITAPPSDTSAVTDTMTVNATVTGSQSPSFTFSSAPQPLRDCGVWTPFKLSYNDYYADPAWMTKYMYARPAKGVYELAFTTNSSLATGFTDWYSRSDSRHLSYGANSVNGTLRKAYANVNLGDTASRSISPVYMLTEAEAAKYGKVSPHMRPVKLDFADVAGDCKFTFLVPWAWVKDCGGPLVLMDDYSSGFPSCRIVPRLSMGM